MTFTIIVIGILLILTGSAIKKYRLYDLIAGYNTMPPQEKAKFNIERFVRILRNVFAITGIIIIAGCLLSLILQIAFFSIAVAFLAILSGVVYLTIKGESMKKR